MYIVLGLGRTGLAVANYFAANGIDFVFNEPNTSAVPLGIKHLAVDSPARIESKKIKAVIASPGISTVYSPANPFILYAREKCIPVISDIHLFHDFFPDKKYIAITGTNGKSTTATLVHKILQSVGKNAALCGNIGQSPFANAVDADICVMEISSFQLEITLIQFDISSVINITPDHLDRYTTFENYAKEKLRIVELSKSCIVNQNINITGSNVIYFSNDAPCTGYSIINGEICYKGEPLCQFPKTKLLGEHNRENIMAAFAVCHQLGVEIPAILKAIENFDAIEHRIEFVREANNVKFYNDSKATNIDSTLNALRAIKAPVFLIAGGKLVEDISDIFANDAFGNVKMVAAVGSSAEIITKELQKHNNMHPNKQIKYCIAGDIKKALSELYFHAQKKEGTVILLSPFCKSFDQFKSFEERGQLFKKYVYDL